MFMISSKSHFIFSKFSKLSSKNPLIERINGNDFGMNFLALFRSISFAVSLFNFAKNKL